MAFTALFTSEPELPEVFQRTVGASQVVVATTSWKGLLRLVRERPVTTSVVDASSLPGFRAPEDAVVDLRTRYPHMGMVLLFGRHTDPVRMFRLGRASVPNVVLLGSEDLRHALPRVLQKASEGGATSLVTRSLSPYLPRRELHTVRVAMGGIHHRWTADEFATVVGLSRPFLSECLKACSLPSAGHLLTWARLLHAGLWLEEPGRTGQSVSRQLEYSSGAAFRRALRLYTGSTPTEVAEGGGIELVLDRFLESCGFAPAGSRVTAA